MATVRSRIRTLRVHVLTLFEGEERVDVLAELGWLIGLGTEVALRVEGPGSRRLRRLHGVLRGLVQLCVEGYRWKQHMAQPMDLAMTDAHELIFNHEAHALELLPGAQYLEARILSRAVTANDVAGAEIYTERTDP